MAGVENRVIEDENLVVALPSHHCLVARREPKLSELADEPFVILPNIVVSSVLVRARPQPRRGRFSPQLAQEAPDNTDAILDLIVAGVGVTLTPSSMLHVRNVGFTFRSCAQPRGCCILRSPGARTTTSPPCTGRSGSEEAKLPTAARAIIPSSSDAMHRGEKD
jgi:DNA-binding transcriptional LysR family regulator